MSVTPNFKELVRIATTQFRLLNRNKSLSAADRKQLKTFFLDRMIGPRVRDVLRQNSTGEVLPFRAPKDHMAGQRLLTAKEVEAWLGIDVKTLYAFAKRKMVPHVRLQGNVRFPARELQKWVDRHSHIPREMVGQPARHTRTKRRTAARAR